MLEGNLSFSSFQNKQRALSLLDQKKMMTFSHDFKFYVCVYSSRYQRGLIVYIIGICLQGKIQKQSQGYSAG